MFKSLASRRIRAQTFFHEFLKNLVCMLVLWSGNQDCWSLFFAQTSLLYHTFVYLESFGIFLISGRNLDQTWSRNPNKGDAKTRFDSSPAASLGWYITLEQCNIFWTAIYSVVSIKRTGSLNYFEVFFHHVRSY